MNILVINGVRLLLNRNLCESGFDFIVIYGNYRVGLC